MSDQYEVLEAIKNKIEAELDEIEEKAEKAEYAKVGFSTQGPWKNNGEAFLAHQWMGLWKQKVAIDMQLYQIAFPDAKLEMNDEGTQFRSVS